MSVLVREFDSIFRDLAAATSAELTNYSQYSNAEEYVLEVALVGMTKENVVVDVQQGVLNVSAKSELKSKLVRGFKNSWSLAKDADVENVSAVLENGLLVVKVPRVKPAKKVVTVNVN